MKREFTCADMFMFLKQNGFSLLRSKLALGDPEGVKVRVTSPRGAVVTVEATTYEAVTDELRKANHENSNH